MVFDIGLCVYTRWEGGGGSIHHPPDRDVWHRSISSCRLDRTYWWTYIFGEVETHFAVCSMDESIATHVPVVGGSTTTP